MSYFRPFIDDAGFHYPTYNEILEDLVDACQRIFGAGFYLGNDSQDYQLLSVMAEKIYDSYQTCEIAYHSHSPITALGTGLDYVVALNGISRRQGTRSTATLTLSGDAGVTISGGVVADANGYMWDLPPVVTIGPYGSADALAVCREAGLITAPSGTINRIMSPTAGWTSVTNDEDAQPGTVTESDSALRARQADSVAQASQSMLQGLKGAVSSIPNVDRCEVYENETGQTNADGIPGNSVCVVVDGGEEAEIARTILLRKGLGCGTYGSTTVQVEADRQAYVVRFSRPTYVDIDVEIRIAAKSKYTASIPQEIVSAVTAYLNRFSIGADLTISILWMIAQQVNADVLNPAFSVLSVKAARHGQALAQTDIDFGFDEVAHGSAANIQVVLSQ